MSAGSFFQTGSLRVRIGTQELPQDACQLLSTAELSCITTPLTAGLGPQSFNISIDTGDNPNLEFVSAPDDFFVYGRLTRISSLA